MNHKHSDRWNTANLNQNKQKKGFLMAKKSLGQNFLTSQPALEEIVSTAEIQKGETVLEIGPGMGVLTEKLLSHGAKVVAVEKDARLIEILERKFAKERSDRKFILIEGDALKIDWGEHLPKKYKVIANIPYYITGLIFRKIFSQKNLSERVVLLVQKEVAERIVAKKKKPLDSARGKESILSLSVKVFGSPRVIRKVPRGSFSPSPTVDSAILLIENINRDFFKNVSEEKFFTAVKKGFSSKRKLLTRNLGFSKEVGDKLFKSLGLNPSTRAEDLLPEEWGPLVQKL